MSFQKFLGFTTSSVLVLALLMYRPLPDVVDEPWIFRLQGFITDLTGSLVSDLTFYGVPVRLYRPKTVTEPAPCIIYFHGGGWVLFNIDDFDATTSKLALGTDMIVISVDYRLSPENPFPTPLDDCLKAVRCLLNNADKFGVDKDRVAVAGDSAGGNLAASVSQILAKENPKKKSPLKLQVLIYPVTQLINFKTSSYIMYKNNLILNRRLMVIYAASYFGLEWSSANLAVLEANHHLSPMSRRSAYGKIFKKEYMPVYIRQNAEDKDTVIDEFDGAVDEEIAEKVEQLAMDPRVSPLLSKDLSILPPTYMTLAEFDVLRDDGLLYAERLRRAGVEVELSYYKGQPHAFMAPRPPDAKMWAGFKGAVKEWENIYDYLRANL